MVFDRQMILISRLDRHQLATSAFVLKCKFLTWEKRWQASAEQLSCLWSSIIGDAWVGGGGSSGGESGSVTCLVETIVGTDTINWVCQIRVCTWPEPHCQSSGVGRESTVFDNNAEWWEIVWDTDGWAESIAWVPRVIKHALWLSVVCVEGWGERWGRLDWLEGSTYLLYSFVTSPMCSWTCVLTQRCDLPM